jgi:hypothetical protein
MSFIEKLFYKEIRNTSRIVLYFFCGVAVIVFLIHGFMVVGFNYPLDYGEGPLLNQALRIINGESLYPANISSPPYLISNYPPVYVMINAFFAWLFGPDLLYGRLISLLSTLGTAIVLGLIVYQISKMKKVFPAITTSAVFLSMPYVVGWSALFRVDMLALFLSVLGLFVILKNPLENRAIYVACVFFILAAYTRQTLGLAAPLTAVIWIALRNWKKAIKFFMLYALGGLVIFGLLTFVTRGGFFFHIIKANVNPFIWKTVFNYAREILNKMPIILGIMTLYLLIGWRFSKSYPFLVPYLLASGLVSMTIGKVGSNVNYLVELCASMSLVVGFSMAAAMNLRPVATKEEPDLLFPKEEIPDPENVPGHIRTSLWLNLGVTTVLSFLVVFQIAGLTRDSLFTRISGHRDRIKPASDYVYLEENIKRSAQKGPILVDEFMGILPDNGIPLYLQPFEFVQLSDAGLWNQEPFLESIRGQEFPLILIHHFQFYPVYLERWTPEMLKAIFERYVPVELKAETVIFEPKSEDQDYPIDYACPDAPWLIPTTADMGMFWDSGHLIMMGSERTGEEPVHAIADGTLYRFPEWETAVAIQHEDPLSPGNYIWSFYGDMAPAFNSTGNYIQLPETPTGMPVQAGDLIGYQGRWYGPSQQTWVHLRFALLPAEADGSFPEALMNIVDPHAELPSFQDQIKLGLDAPISITQYTGLPESDLFGILDFLPFFCEKVGE